jgi:hypothetical protein
MSDKMLRRLLMDRVIERGLPYLRDVLAAANVDRISGLSTEQLRAIVEERSDAS